MLVEIMVGFLNVFVHKDIGSHFHAMFPLGNTIRYDWNVFSLQKKKKAASNRYCETSSSSM